MSQFRSERAEWRVDQGWEGFRSWSLAIMQCEMKYDELFTHKDIYYYVLLSIMTIAKLPHTQRLHFSHLSVCGLLFAASPIITCQTKQRGPQIQIICEWKILWCLHTLYAAPIVESCDDHVMASWWSGDCHVVALGRPCGGPELGLSAMCKGLTVSITWEVGLYSSTKMLLLRMLLWKLLWKFLSWVSIIAVAKSP